MPSRNGDELIILIPDVCVRPDDIGIGWPRVNVGVECAQNFFYSVHTFS